MLQTFVHTYDLDGITVSMWSVLFLTHEVSFVSILGLTLLQLGAFIPQTTVCSRLHAMFKRAKFRLTPKVGSQYWDSDGCCNGAFDGIYN